MVCCISSARTFYLKLNIIFLPHVFAEPQEFVPLTSPAPAENRRNFLANCDCENVCLCLDKNIYFIEMITGRVRPCYGLITTAYPHTEDGGDDGRPDIKRIFSCSLLKSK